MSFELEQALWLVRNTQANTATVGRSRRLEALRPVTWSPGLTLRDWLAQRPAPLVLPAAVVFPAA